MKKALIKTHLAAGKNSSGKSLIKKRFPKLGVAKNVKSSGGTAVQTYTLSPTVWTATNAAGTAYTNNVTITSNISTINIGVDFTNLGTGINGAIKFYKNNVSIYTQAEGSLSAGLNTNVTPPFCCPLTSGDQLKFDLSCLSGGGATSMQFQLYQLTVGGTIDYTKPLGNTFTLTTNC
jgi:hypothetical protein